MAKIVLLGDCPAFSQAGRETPQARYNREVRRDPLVRAKEAEAQKARRHTKRYRAIAAAYQRRWRAKRSAP